MSPIYILGIESSCDDTSAAVLRNDELLSNVTASQAVHEAYGGVVPELASRAHQQNVVPVVSEAIRQAGITKEQLSAIAFTRGPGLMGSLLVGVNFAKGLARSLGIPLIDVNHLQGHVMAHFIKQPTPCPGEKPTPCPGEKPTPSPSPGEGSLNSTSAKNVTNPSSPGEGSLNSSEETPTPSPSPGEGRLNSSEETPTPCPSPGEGSLNSTSAKNVTNPPSPGEGKGVGFSPGEGKGVGMVGMVGMVGIPPYPFLCLLVSGGNSQIVKVRAYNDMEVLGQTIDDAAGEAIDKCSKVMGLGYPGGPIIDRLARQGNPKAYQFSEPHIPGLDYSFSGLKTSFLYSLQKWVADDPQFIEHHKEDLAASLEYTIVDILMKKLKLAVKLTGIKHVAVAGGVSANNGLRNAFHDHARRYGWTIYIPKFSYTTDNAAMIGVVGYHKYLDGDFCSIDAPAFSKVTFE